MNYENVVEEFNKKCCKLLVTKEEYRYQIFLIITIKDELYYDYRHKING